MGSPLALFLLDFTCWINPAFRDSPWAPPTPAPTSSLVAVPDSLQCSHTFPWQAHWNGTSYSRCSLIDTKHKTIRHFTLFFKIKDANTYFLLSVVAFYTTHTLQPSVYRTTQEHYFCTPLVDVCCSRGVSTCRHSRPCEQPLLLWRTLERDISQVFFCSWQKG